MRVIVVGHGMAGARVTSELCARDADVKVVAFSAEPHRPYNRIMLSTLLAGGVCEDDLVVSAPPAGADVRLGTAVTAIDRARRVVLTGEEEHAYDALVLATGSRPVLPPVEGLDLPGAYPFRTLDDCRAIAAAVGAAASGAAASGAAASGAAASGAAASAAAGAFAGGSAGGSAGRAIVLGGGLLGLEAARALATRGLSVTVVHAGGHVADRQLDPDGSAVLARTLAGLGVRVRTGARAVAWTGAGLRLVDGTTLPAALLVVACGVRPDTGLAAAAGLAVGRGVLVDDELRTSDPRIRAIGDCAEHRGTVYGLVAPAWEQAATVAARLTGTAASYRGSRLVTRLKASGIDLASMGSIAAGADAEVVSFADPARGTYARLVIRDNRIAGAVLLGDNPTVGTVVQLFDRDAEVPADRRALLLGRALGGDPAGAPMTRADSPAFMPDQAVVCRCNSVRKAAIVASWRAGARTVADVVARTRATTGCGGCADAVCGIVDWLSTVDSNGNLDEGAA